MILFCYRRWLLSEVNFAADLLTKIKLYKSQIKFGLHLAYIWASNKNFEFQAELQGLGRALARWSFMNFKDSYFSDNEYIASLGRLRREIETRMQMDGTDFVPWGTKRAFWKYLVKGEEIYNFLKLWHSSPLLQYSGVDYGMDGWEK